MSDDFPDHDEQGMIPHEERKYPVLHHDIDYADMAYLEEDMGKKEKQALQAMLKEAEGFIENNKWPPESEPVYVRLMMQGNIVRLQVLCSEDTRVVGHKPLREVV